MLTPNISNFSLLPVLKESMRSSILSILLKFEKIWHHLAKLNQFFVEDDEVADGSPR
jgi:hypothetical protein